MALVIITGLGGGTGKYPYRLFGLNPLNVSNGDADAGGNAGFGLTLGGRGGTGKCPYLFFGMTPHKLHGGGAGGNACTDPTASESLDGNSTATTIKAI